MSLIANEWTRGLGLFLAAAVIAAGAEAQVTPPGFVHFPEDPGVALSRHLVAIAESPNSVPALTGAGEAALALGDSQAALGFFARAEELAPRDGRVKAGMGSALVMLEQARPALRFFDEATDFGIPEARVAGDRGLAYDLVGNPRRAQRDYQLALKHEENAEVRRRLALSLAISGERKAALGTIEAQLRNQDRAAWRTRAFILALTGDARGAAEAVRAVMPPQAAAAMIPFLEKLPSLGPGDRALAVNFGHFPEDAALRVTAEAPGAAHRDALTMAGAPDVNQAPLGPGVAPDPQPAPAAVPSTAMPALDEEPAPALQRAGLDQLEPLSADDALLGRSQAESFLPGAPEPLETAAATPITPTAVPPSIDAKPATPEPAGNDPAPVSSFADVAALVESLAAGSADAGDAIAGPASAADAAPPAPAAERKTTARTDAGPGEPSRIWVQVAGGADQEALPREFARLKTRAPALFDGRTAWTTPLNATNRLLVGPFESDKEAQDFVNRLAEAELAGFSWTSPVGQEITKLTAQ